ncbi:MAG: META domain-containing protein, partial [Deltaproteobacteria bacterium]|nr:META domain-containing protein [Deltaproteobacteria bacterium]
MNKLIRLSLYGALALALTLSGCKKGKDSQTANGANQEPNPSGVMTPATLENVYWALLELNAAKKSAYGFGGCNRFFGSYDVGKQQALTFGA